MSSKFMKSAAVLGTATLASLLLVACGSKTADKAADTSSSEAKEITFYVEDQYKAFAESAAKAYEKESGVKVTIKTGDQMGGLDNLSLDNQSGKAPDVMMAPYDRVGSLGTDGQLSEVTLNDGAKTDDTTKSLVTVGGKVYGAPAVIESLVMYYNKDLIKEAPKTFAELEELAKDSKYAFAGEDGKTTAFLADWTNFYYAYGLLAGNGGYVFGQNGKDPKDIGLANDGAIKGIEYAKSWYEKWPKGMQDTEGAGNLIQTQFQEGKTAAIIDGPWKAQSFKDAKVNYGVATIPTLPNGKNYEAFGGGWQNSGNYNTAFEGFDFGRMGGGFSSFFQDLFGGGSRGGFRKQTNYSRTTPQSQEVEVSIDLYTALLGGEIVVMLPQGKKVKLKVKPYTQNGTKVRIKSKDNSGDTILKYNVKLPTVLTENQKEHLLQMRNNA